MPRSRARLSAALAFSSSSYMRKRLPQPNARMETFALVRPSVRVGSGDTGGAAAERSGRRDRVRPAVVTPIRSRNFLRERSSVTGHLQGDGHCNAGRRETREPNVGFRNIRALSADLAVEILSGSVSLEGGAL